MNLEVRNVKTLALVDESQPFNASLYIDGRKAAVVSNDGHGGSNLYVFDDGAVEQAFLAHAREWGKRHDCDYEPEDLLVAHLIEDAELRTQARDFTRSGLPVCVLIEKSPVDVAGHTFYDDSYLVGAPAGTDPADIAAQEAADRWRVIAA